MMLGGVIGHAGSTARRTRMSRYGGGAAVQGVQSRMEIAAIKAGESVSSPVTLSDAIAVGVVWPEAFTGTTVTYRVSHTASGPFHDLGMPGHVPSWTVAPGAAFAYGPWAIDNLLPWRYLQFVSDAVEAAERLIEVHIK